MKGAIKWEIFPQIWHVNYETRLSVYKYDDDDDDDNTGERQIIKNFLVLYICTQIYSSSSIWDFTLYDFRAVSDDLKHFESHE